MNKLLIGNVKGTNTIIQSLIQKNSMPIPYKKLKTKMISKIKVEMGWRRQNAKSNKSWNRSQDNNRKIRFWSSEANMKILSSGGSKEQ